MTQKTQKKGFSLEKLTQNTVFLSVISLILSLLVAGLVMMIAGYSPIEGYSAMFTGAFGSVDNIAQTLGTATPLIFAGLAMAFAARGGMFNIGIEGQIIAGAMPAALVGAYCSGLPWFIHVPLCFAAGMIGGGLWAMLAGFLKNKLRVSEVILTIMLNYVMQYLAEYLANYQFKAEGMLVRTETILPSAELPTLIPYSRLTTGIFVALAFAVFCVYFSINGVLQGSGDVMFTAFNTFSGLAIKVAFVYITAFLTPVGMAAIWWGNLVSWIYSLVLAALRYRFGPWRSKCVVTEEAA